MRAASRIPLALAVLLVTPPAEAGGDPLLAVEQTVAYERAGAVRLTIDFAELLVLDEPASTIIVGNSAIAAASLTDDRTLILTGRTAGATNLIVLDAEGEEIANLVLEVVAAGNHLITVHQGQSRRTFACARRCEPVLSVGDDAELFSATASQINTRSGFTDTGQAGQ
ncbi:MULTISPECIES: pilus assembly protein N-terminal domain-containing protein [Chelativorans]|uniref:Pilus formation protein N-terminal domain-containing protein n=1 Tax=Chelativorans sp. (strain BNC1) TaxID=266779 RepID=Q11KR9_CHESB|nr:MULTISPECIES: pilus assembly protein N-terminal domain-containing protein [Chelativorans]